MKAQFWMFLLVLLEKEDRDALALWSGVTFASRRVKDYSRKKKIKPQAWEEPGPLVRRNPPALLHRLVCPRLTFGVSELPAVIFSDTY